MKFSDKGNRVCTICNWSSTVLGYSNTPSSSLVSKLTNTNFSSVCIEVKMTIWLQKQVSNCDFASGISNHISNSSLDIHVLDIDNVSRFCMKGTCLWWNKTADICVLEIHQHQSWNWWDGNVCSLLRSSTGWWWGSSLSGWSCCHVTLNDVSSERDWAVWEWVCWKATIDWCTSWSKAKHFYQN